MLPAIRDVAVLHALVQLAERPRDLAVVPGCEPPHRLEQCRRLSLGDHQLPHRRRVRGPGQVFNHRPQNLADVLRPPVKHADYLSGCFLGSQFAHGRPLSLTPSIPQDRVRSWRHGYPAHPPAAAAVTVTGRCLECGGSQAFPGLPDNGPGVPMNVASMNDPRRAARSGLSILSLQFEVPDNHPDWPVVRVLADGRDPFAAVAPGWRGFDPAKMLGPRSPLLPEDQGRRVAVYCCTCGEPGCGVIAPVILPSPDGRRVSWVDFRDYTGVFTGPTARSAVGAEGRPWDLPDLHFYREQYVAEIERATADGSWETGRRRTARLLYEHLEPLKLVLPPDLALAWAEPAWNTDGVALMFQRITSAPRPQVRQQMLRLTSTLDDPGQAAEDMAHRLLSTSPDHWVSLLGWRRA
jgi:hypothetical protein